jgi:hypothetical protein
MDDTQARDTGRLAVALGLVSAGSAVCLTAFFVVGGPFGTINDIGNGATGVLSAVLAWRLGEQLTGRARDVALGAALVGGAVAVVGSALVISGATGFFLAGLVSSVGFAAIGTWVVLVNRGDRAATWPRGLRSLGVLAGVLMAIGIVAAPGILLRLDNMETAPGWIWVGFLGWFGTFVAYPAWALWLGAVERRLAPAGAAGSGSSARVPLHPGT